MKRFIINILIVLFGAIGILSIMTWNEATSLQRANFKLPQKKHIAAIGPSTTARALNDSIIGGLFNMSRNAVWLSDVLPLLPKLLDENPQIDTVLINHGRFLFIHMGQAKEEPSLHLLREKLPLFFYDKSQTNWNVLLSDIDFFAAILTPDFYNMTMTKKSELSDFGFGHKKKPEKYFIDCPQLTGVAEYDSLKKKHGSTFYSKEWILKNCADEEASVRKAIEVCKQRNVVPVLFFTPLYNYSNWYSWDGFCDFIKDYDENILIADYEDFEFPDLSYRSDIIHLNEFGADYLSTDIARKGLNAIPLKEWLKNKGY
ncbi:MAG: hypothetical protein E7077_12985 [Bacteroidales bacterium]|nr:hypothetical protein [Bacteroidales bacterium]